MGALEIARVVLAILTQATPALIREYSRQRELGEQNKALRLAVLENEEEIRKLPIGKVIEIGVKKK